MSLTLGDGVAIASIAIGAAGTAVMAIVRWPNNKPPANGNKPMTTDLCNANRCSMQQQIQAMERRLNRLEDAAVRRQERLERLEEDQ